MGESETFHRWYDSRPKMSQAAKLLFSLPDELKSILSEAVLTIGEREFSDKKWEPAARSLGREKVMGLHKSKNKRREYDENPELHAAMNALYVLPEDKREVMAEHVLKMGRFIQHYLESCQLAQTTPQMEQVADVIRQYIFSGEKKVEAFLKRLRYELYEQMKKNQAMESGKITGFLKEGVAIEEGFDMKVSKLE